MKILILGSRSMAGRRIHAKLSERHDVRMAGRDGAAEVFFDLKGGATLGEIGSIDAIVHCAASFGGGSIEEMLENEEVNAVGALRVASLAQRVACKHVVFISTIFVYDHPDNGYFGSYGLSKRHAQENLHLWCRQSGVAFSALLPSQLYDAAGDARRHQPFLYRIVDSAREGREVILFGKADPIRNYLYADDLATAVERVLDTRAQGIFPCLAPESCRVSELARIAFDVFGTEARIVRLADKPDVPGVYLPQDDALFDATGYRPSTGIKAGLIMIRDHGVTK